MRCTVVLPMALLGLALSGVPAAAQAEMASWQLAAERLLSAFKVNTLQRNTVGQQAATSEVQARTAFSSTLQAQAASHRAMEIRNTYGTDTGQGYGVCASKYAMSSMVQAEKSSGDIATAFAGADRSWLTRGGDATSRAAELAEARKSFYCSKEERAALPQWCAQGNPRQRGIPAGDTDAAPFMLRPDIGPEEAMTAADYIDTVAPLPTVASAAPVTLAEHQAQAEARRKGAFATASRGAFAAVVSGRMGGNGEGE